MSLRHYGRGEEEDSEVVGDGDRGVQRSTALDTAREHEVHPRGR